MTRFERFLARVIARLPAAMRPTLARAWLWQWQRRRPMPRQLPGGLELDPPGSSAARQRT